MGRGARPIMKGSRARRKEQRREEGSYASSLPADDGGFLHSDSGLTLLPGSQIQQVEVVGNGSAGPDGAVSDEQEYDSPRQRRSIRLAARNAGSTMELALDTTQTRSVASSLVLHTRRTRSVASSPVLHTVSSDNDSDQGKRKRRNINSLQSAIPSFTIIPSPATSITFSSIDSVSLPITSFTDPHTQTSDLICQLPSIEQDTTSLFNTGNYSLGLPAPDRMAYAPTLLQSPFQQPLPMPPQMAPQPSFQPYVQSPIQPNTNMNYAVMSNGHNGKVVHPSEADLGILWRKMSEAITHRDQVIKFLQNDKCILEGEIKRLNNTNIGVNHELGRLLDKIRTLENCQRQNQLCGPPFESPSRGPEFSQPQMQHAIEAPVDRSNPFQPQMQDSIAQADKRHILALQRAAEQRNREMAQLQEEMARMRSERDRYKANAEKAATYVKNVQAMNAAATKATPAKEIGRTALEILSSFRVQTPQPPPRVTSALEQAPGLSGPQAVSPTQLDFPVPSAPEAHLASTALSVRTAPSVSTALPVSVAQSKAAASPVPAERSASSSQQHATIDLTVEEPSPSIATNPNPGRTASCPDIGDSSALTALGAAVAPKKRTFSWLGHHPLSKTPHPRGWKNIESTPAAMLQKRLASGLVEPVTARKGKQKAKQAAEKPTNGNKCRKGKNAVKDRPAKKQRLGKDHLQDAPIPGSATDNDDGTSASTDAPESDGLDEEMDRLLTMGDDDSEPADSQEDTSILAAATKDDGICTSTDAQESDGLDEEMDRLFAMGDDENEPSDTQEDTTMFAATTNDDCPSTITITQIGDVVAEEIERALAEHSSDDSEPLGAADGRAAPLRPVAMYHADDSGDVLNNANSSDECPRCGLDIGHGGEKCQFENDGLDDLFDDGEDD